MKKKLGVLDYGAGNLRSVLNAFEAIGEHAALVTKPADFDGIDLLVFRGRGRLHRDGTRVSRPGRVR